MLDPKAVEFIPTLLAVLMATFPLNPLASEFVSGATAHVSKCGESCFLPCESSLNVNAVPFHPRAGHVEVEVQAKHMVEDVDSACADQVDEVVVGHGGTQPISLDLIPQDDISCVSGLAKL